MCISGNILHFLSLLLSYYYYHFYHYYFFKSADVMNLEEIKVILNLKGIDAFASQEDEI